MNVGEIIKSIGSINQYHSISKQLIQSTLKDSLQLIQTTDSMDDLMQILLEIRTSDAIVTSDGFIPWVQSVADIASNNDSLKIYVTIGLLEPLMEWRFKKDDACDEIFMKAVVRWYHDDQRRWVVEEGYRNEPEKFDSDRQLFGLG